MITTINRHLRMVRVGNKSQFVVGTVYDARRVEDRMSQLRSTDVDEARMRQLQARRRLQAA